MKTTLRWLSVVALVFGMAGASRASQMDYYLWVDSAGPGTWSLSASTDAPNGIAAFVTNLDNAVTGTSVAPRASSPPYGFVGGNVFAHPAGGGNQAFAYQPTTGSPGSGTIVYNIGASSVPNASFVPGALTGSASVDGNPFSAGLQVRLYDGTYTGGAATRVKYSAPQGTPISGSANVAVTGAGPGITSMQPINGGSVFTAGTPSEAATVPTLNYHVIWTPDINGDGFIGGTDLNFVLAKWGQNVTAYDRANGDLNGDGFVGGSDLNLVLGAWGQNLYAGAINAVPEPSAICLLAIGGLGVTLYRRRSGNKGGF